MSDKSNKTKGDYEVGYGRPPKHTQFKPGQSGNPKGRPKGSKNLATILEGVLSRGVMVVENGKQRKMSFREAFIHRMVARTMEGSPRDMIALLAALEKHFPEALRPADTPSLINVRFVKPDWDAQLAEWEQEKVDQEFRDAGLADDEEASEPESWGTWVKESDIS